MAKKTKGKNSVESVAETLCNFSRFLCDIVISVYLFVILAVLPLYTRGYAQIGTDKENFFMKTMTYAGKCLLPLLVLWLIFRLAVAKQKRELPKFRDIPKSIWQALNTTDKFAVLYGISVVLSYVFTRYREEALWGTASWRMGMWTQLGAVIVYFMISRMWQRNDWIVILTLPVSTIVFFLGYMNKFGLCLVDKEIINSSFISTVGNINWYCGYLVTVLVGGVYLLWWKGSEITWKRALLMGYVTIGFASLAALKDTVKAVSVDGVTASEATVKDGTYKVQRPFVLVTKEGTELSDTAQKFFDYATSADAAEVISAAGAVSAN